MTARPPGRPARGGELHDPPGFPAHGPGNPGGSWTPLGREFFGRAPEVVGPGLLGCLLVHDTPAGLVAVELTETEAYAGAADPASHAYRGPTARNAVMFGPPGHAYVYFSYGMHFCVNLVCGLAGAASAVLLRAGRVVEGSELASARRSAGRSREATFRELARGPGKLGQALGIDRSLNGADVCAAASPLRICLPPGPPPGLRVSRGPRVGVSQAADVPWRFWRTGDPCVSAYRRSAPGAPAGERRARNRLPPVTR